MKRKQSTPPQPEQPIEITQLISATNLRKMLDVSRTNLDRLIASGVFGESITLSDARNAMRYFRRHLVNAFIGHREQKTRREQYEIKAKAARALR